MEQIQLMSPVGKICSLHVKSTDLDFLINKSHETPDHTGHWGVSLLISEGQN